MLLYIHTLTQQNSIFYPSAAIYSRIWFAPCCVLTWVASKVFSTTWIPLHTFLQSNAIITRVKWCLIGRGTWCSYSNDPHLQKKKVLFVLLSYNECISMLWFTFFWTYTFGVFLKCMISCMSATWVNYYFTVCQCDLSFLEYTPVRVEEQKSVVVSC